MENFWNQELFPEVSANEIPVKVGVLEKKSERKHQFAFEDAAIPADGKCERDHGDCSQGGHEKPELQDADEQPTLRGAFAKIG